MSGYPPQIYQKQHAPSLEPIIKIFHANFGINRLISLRARAATIKHNKQTSDNQCKSLFNYGLDHNFEMSLDIKELGGGSGKFAIEKHKITISVHFFCLALFSHLGWKRGKGQDKFSFKIKVGKTCEIVISSLSIKSHQFVYNRPCMIHVDKKYTRLPCN